MDQPIKESFQMKSLIPSIQIEHLKVFNVPLTCATTMSHFTKIPFPTLTITMKILHVTLVLVSVTRILIHVECQTKTHQHVRQGLTGRSKTQLIGAVRQVLVREIIA